MKTFTKSKILVVEANADHWELIQEALQQTMPGVTVLWARDRQQALNLLENEFTGYFPKLILLELHLPTLSEGQQLLQELREPTSLFRLIPITVFSQSDLQEDIYAAYELGCSSYIIKSNDTRKWLSYFKSISEYWWHTVTIPKTQ